MGKLIKITDDEKFEYALGECEKALKKGGIIAIPTDTVYGFAALVHDENAIAQLYKVKEREANKSIAVLLGDAVQAEEIAFEFPDHAKRMAEKYWPGGLTLIVRKKAGLPSNLTANETIGLRIPDYEFTRELIRRTGPLAVTSANHSGKPPARCVEEFIDELGSAFDVIIDGGASEGGVPSTVVNCSVQPPVILREGAIPGEDLLKC